MLNHSNEFNCIYTNNIIKPDGCIFQLYSIKEILPDEELTIFYCPYLCEDLYSDQNLNYNEIKAYNVDTINNDFETYLRMMRNLIQKKRQFLENII